MRPITPQPGHSEADVVNAMSAQQFVYADCYEFIPKSGDPIRYTTAQQDVSVVPIGGIARVTYYAKKVNITGLRVKNNLGVEVDEQQVQLDYPANTIFQNYLTWPEALLQGRLDGGRVRRDRFIATEWGNGFQVTDWLGGFPMFLGLVSSLSTVGRMTATINVKSDLVLLNVQAPRDLWEANCKNTLGDVGCGININDFSAAGTVGVSPTRTFIPWAGVSSDYALGKIYIENFDSVTRIRTISRVDGSGLYLTYPLDFDPAAGMMFTAFQGCDRTKARCPHFWGATLWVQHFKGFPFVPVEETALGNA